MARTSAHAHRCVLMNKVNGVEAFVVPPVAWVHADARSACSETALSVSFHHGSRCVRTDDAHIGVHASEQIM